MPNDKYWKLGNWKLGIRCDKFDTGNSQPAVAAGNRTPLLAKEGTKGWSTWLALLFAVTLLLSHPASAQVATGFPPYGSFGGGPFDTVNNANLNVHFAIPIINKAGRGLPFDYAVSYDSSIWSPVSSTGAHTWTPVGQRLHSTWGWGGTSEVLTGYVTYWVTQEQCAYDARPYYYNVYSSWVLLRRPGYVSHSFPGLSVSNGNTTPCTSHYPPYSGDGSCHRRLGLANPGGCRAGRHGVVGVGCGYHSASANRQPRLRHIRSYGPEWKRGQRRLPLTSATLY